MSASLFNPDTPIAGLTKHPSFETIQLHAGHIIDKDTNSRAVPIYNTATYTFNNCEHGARVFALKEYGNIYSRISNPTVEVFESRMAYLEGGISAVAASSGMSAIFMAIAAVARSGDNIVATSNLYGGSFNLLRTFLPRLGVNSKLVVSDKAEDYESQIDDHTRAVYLETMGNPSYNIPDFENICRMAHAKGVPVIVDNTFGAGGYFFRPFQHGADIIIHSATKWIGGHGTTVGGIVIDSGNFNWGSPEARVRFPDMVNPSKAYDNVSFFERFGRRAFIVRLRCDVLRELGSSMNPFAAQQILLGIETLSLRAQRHGENALAMARWLQKNPNVTWVSYPGLESHPSHQRALKYFHNGFGGVLSFGIKGGAKAGAQVVDNFKLISNLANVGDAKSLAIHAWTTTHAQLSPQEKLNAGVTEDLIRFSVGIENIEDIKHDFVQSFEKCDFSKEELTNGAKEEHIAKLTSGDKPNGHKEDEVNAGLAEGIANGIGNADHKTDREQPVKQEV